MSRATGGWRRRLGVASALVIALCVGGAAPIALASPPATEPAAEPAGQPTPQPDAEPEPTPDPDVGVGEVDGTTVAVGAPPVPPTPVPTTVVVAVGQPPVPPKRAPVKPASVANRPAVQPVEPPQAKVSAAAQQVTAGLAVLTELL